MKLAVLMDPLHRLDTTKDSTLAMLTRAEALGFDCYYFTMHDLYARQGDVYAQISTITMQGSPSLTPVGECKLTSFDIILMRKDPPFDLEYIYATYLLEWAERHGVLVVNKPQSLRDANEKMVTLQCAQCCPQTLVSRDIKRLKHFWEEHRAVIFKPLDGMAGRSIFYVGDDGLNLPVILETLTQNEQSYIMAQVYIPAIKTSGDKRILLINGEPVPYALARIPAASDIRGNLAAGACGKVVPLTERDRWICAEIAPLLKSKGLYFVGIDVIGDYLTEVNVTSPTGICQIMKETGLDITGDFLHFLETLGL